MENDLEHHMQLVAIRQQAEEKNRRQLEEREQIVALLDVNYKRKLLEEPLEGDDHKNIHARKLRMQMQLIDTRKRKPSKAKAEP